jgi:tetratricopeptide (TPR) repeat protein
MTAAKASTLCPCASGLRQDRCCALDLAVTPVGPGPTATVQDAAAALRGGDAAGAERRLVGHLEAWPLDLAALGLLTDLRRAQGRPAAVESLLKRIVAVDPNQLGAAQALALALFNRADLVEAEKHARNAVRLAPGNAQSHNLMGMIMTEAQRPHVGEHHYRRVLELLPQRSPIVLANLAWNLKNQGRMQEARELYEESVRLDPNVFQTLLGWARLEETDRNFERAAELAAAAEAASPGHSNVLLTQAVVEGRRGHHEKAIGILDRLADGSESGLGPVEWAEKGQLLDRLGRADEAFAAFTEGKRTLRAQSGHSYLRDESRSLAKRLRGFFQKGRLDLLPRAGVRSDVPQPIFIVGFPRSGTTMVEQTLSSHPDISAGDELPTINELTDLLPQMLNSPMAYPEALADLWFGDQLEGLDNLRDLYLQRARQLGAMTEGRRWFTDKMPLNETHLGLIHMIFPASPIVHVVRHPLDVALSVFSNHMTHGLYCAYDLGSIAEHYVLTADLVEHYRQEAPLRYLQVRYEDLVRDQEMSVRRMLDFLGLPFEPRCLDFHENRRYARTASYAQVTEKLYDRSVGRFRPYLEHLQPIVPILEPAMARYGYTAQ